MIKKNNSFTSFRNILKSTISSIKTQKIQQNGMVNELLLESCIKEDSQQSQLLRQNNKYINKGIKGVQSSIDSTSKKPQSDISIPLSQLIMRDVGYDYLFDQKHQKLLNKVYSNYKQIAKQTEQMIDLTLMSIYTLEEQQLKSKIILIQKQLLKLRLQKRKSKSPLQQNSEYCYFSKKRKQRSTARQFNGYNKENKSHMRTQCESKVPTLQSMPVTPISQNKLMLSPSKYHPTSYYGILQKKRDIIKDSIQTLNLYNQSKFYQLNEQCDIIRQQILYLTTRMYQSHKSPQKKSVFYSNSNRFKEQDRSSSTKHRRLLGFYSPRNAKDTSKKSNMLKLISIARNDHRLSPREEYLLSN